jgi:hypothetical protein
MTKRNRGRQWLARILYTAALGLALLYAFSEHNKSVHSKVTLEEASRRFSIYLIAEGIQAFRDSTGTLPATLEDIGLDEEGIAYRTNGQTYRIISLEGTKSIIYVEGDDPNHFATAFTVLESGAVQ